MATRCCCSSPSWVGWRMEPATCHGPAAWAAKRLHTHCPRTPARAQTARRRAQRWSSAPWWAAVSSHSAEHGGQRRRQHTAIAWLITSVGMLALALFLNLARANAPGFGHLRLRARQLRAVHGLQLGLGLLVHGGVGQRRLLRAAVFPRSGTTGRRFGDGNTPLAVGCASVMLWGRTRWCCAASASGADQPGDHGGPSWCHCCCSCCWWRWRSSGRCSAPTSGAAPNCPQLGSVLEQVRGMMLVTVWVFIGVGGASVYSAHASGAWTWGAPRWRAPVRAGAAGGRQPAVDGRDGAAQAGAAQDPSMAYVLERAVGHWGGC